MIDIGLDSLMKYTDQHLAGYHEQTRSLYAHLCKRFLITLRSEEKSGGWIPLAEKYLDKVAPMSRKKGDINRLVADGILEMKPANPELRQCRMFRPSLDELLRLLDFANISAPVVTPVRPPPLHHQDIYDQSRHLKSKLVKGAIDLILHQYNRESLVGKLNKRFDKMLRVPDPQFAFKELSKLLANFLCVKHLLQTSTELSHPIYQQKPFYRLSYTGRVFEIGSGLQGISRDLKREAYRGIDNLYNYDLRSSIPAAMITIMQQNNLDSGVLADYVHNSMAKTKYAEASGISVPLWKQCFMSIYFGATLTKRGAPYGLFQNYFKERELLDKKFDQFLEVIRPFLEVRTVWNNYVKSLAAQSPILKNAVGLRLNTADYSTSQISAFITQGLESAYIHHLTILSQEYGYQVLSNEHDGLVTVGVIPPEAMEKARQLTGFDLASLEIKHFSK